MLKKIRTSTSDWLGNYQKSSVDDGLQRLTMCKKCYTFYYRNEWHFEKPKLIEDGLQQEVVVHFSECPPCLAEEMASYELETGLAVGV